MQKTNCNKEITKNKAKTNYNAQSKNKKWSGRRESDPRNQFGRLRLYH